MEGLEDLEDITKQVGADHCSVAVMFLRELLLVVVGLTVLMVIQGE